MTRWKNRPEEPGRFFYAQVLQLPSIADDACEARQLIFLFRRPDESQDPASFNGRRCATKATGSRPSPGWRRWWRALAVGGMSMVLLLPLIW